MRNEEIAKEILFSIGCDLGVVGIIDWKDIRSQQKIVMGIQKALDAKDSEYLVLNKRYESLRLANNHLKKECAELLAENEFMSTEVYKDAVAEGIHDKLNNLQAERDSLSARNIELAKDYSLFVEKVNELQAENQSLKKEVDALLDGHAGDKGMVKTLIQDNQFLKRKHARLIQLDNRLIKESQRQADELFADLEEIREAIKGASLRPSITGVSILDDVRDIIRDCDKLTAENQSLIAENAKLTEINKKYHPDYKEVSRLREENKNIVVCLTCTGKFYAPRNILNLACPHCLIPKLFAEKDAYKLENDSLTSHVSGLREALKPFADEYDRLTEKIRIATKERPEITTNEVMMLENSRTVFFRAKEALSQPPSSLERVKAERAVIASLYRFKDKFEAFSRYQNQHLSKGLEEAKKNFAEVSDSGMLDFSNMFEALANLKVLGGENGV